MVGWRCFGPPYLVRGSNGRTHTLHPPCSPRPPPCRSSLLPCLLSNLGPLFSNDVAVNVMCLLARPHCNLSTTSTVLVEPQGRCFLHTYSRVARGWRLLIGPWLHPSHITGSTTRPITAQGPTTTMPWKTSVLAFYPKLNQLQASRNAFIRQK